MQNRCKLIVQSVADTNAPTGSSNNKRQVITLTPIHGPEADESPGLIEVAVTINSPELIGSFKRGQEYYLDLVSTSKAQAA